MDYWMGSIEDFINEMNTNWWVKEKRKTDKISENIGCEIFENLPLEIQKTYLVILKIKLMKTAILLKSSTEVNMGKGIY